MGVPVLVLLLNLFQNKHHLDFDKIKKKVNFKFSKNIGGFLKMAQVIDGTTGKFNL